MWLSDFLLSRLHRLALALRMARPGFLVITAVGCLIGVASAVSAGSGVSGLRALVTLVLALLAHAAANMLNDHADALNGADAANTQGLFPFTGGSRLVQSGAVPASAMLSLAQVLLALVAAGGLWLALYSGPALVLVGLAGGLLGWAYSMPPLALMSRGLGELAVGLAWGLVVVGADYVQRGHFAPAPLAGIQVAQREMQRGGARLGGDRRFQAAFRKFVICLSARVDDPGLGGCVVRIGFECAQVVGMR